MKIDRRSLLGAFAAAGLACAHAQPSPASPDTRTERVFVTGSHIAQRVDLASSLPPTMAPMRVYSRAQLEGTGRAYDLRAALGNLDTAITP
jgi:hypothetical protein